MNLLENYPTYSHFSNKAWYPNDASTYDSLESLHDQIHGLVGTNGGHMAYVSKFFSLDNIGSDASAIRSCFL